MRGGERVGLLGLSRAMATRDIVDRLAEILLVESRRASAHADLPPAQALAPRTRAILVGDFLVSPDAFAERLRTLSSRGASGLVIMIADPVEENLPFSGHVEFLDVDSCRRLRIGRAESWRADYQKRLAAHRAAIADIARAHDFTLILHRTDRPASEALLALRARLEAGSIYGAIT